MALAFTPVTYFSNSTNQLYVPLRSDVRTLPQKTLRKLEADGYEKRTISNFREYERFCRSRTSYLRAENEAQMHDDAETRSLVMQSVLDGLSQGVKVGKGSEARTMRLQDMQPKVQEIAHLLIEANRNGSLSKLDPSVIGRLEQAGYPTHQIKEMMENQRRSNYDPQVHIEAFEMDCSHYIDHDTGWKRRYV